MMESWFWSKAHLCFTLLKEENLHSNQTRRFINTWILKTHTEIQEWAVSKQAKLKMFTIAKFSLMISQFPSKCGPLISQLDNLTTCTRSFFMNPFRNTKTPLKIKTFYISITLLILAKSSFQNLLDLFLKNPFPIFCLKLWIHSFNNLTKILISHLAFENTFCISPQKRFSPLLTQLSP